jgi:hypothetical protein
MISPREGCLQGDAILGQGDAGHLSIQKKIIRDIGKCLRKDCAHASISCDRKEGQRSAQEYIFLDSALPQGIVFRYKNISSRATDHTLRGERWSCIALRSVIKDFSGLLDKFMRGLT